VEESCLIQHGYAIKKAMKIATDNPIDNLFFGDYDE
jgi:hypothetical protein